MSSSNFITFDSNVFAFGESTLKHNIGFQYNTASNQIFAGALSTGLMSTTVFTFGDKFYIGSNAYSLPLVDGVSTNVLATNGAGTVSWVSATSGPIGATGPTGPTGDIGPTGPISLNYICQASLTSDQTITSNIDTRIQFTDEYDPNNWWTSSNTFNPTINGYYLVTAAIWWAAGVSNLSNQTNLQIRQNGSTQKAIVQSPIEWNSGNTQIVTRLIQLNGSTDYLDITAYTGNTTSQVIQAGSGSGTWFSAALQ
jgi:hypothetical protein